VNTLIKPRIPPASEPSRDDDPTGVRALLSSLPEPDPMPEHLVKRIYASLAAEQAQRATKMSTAAVTPLPAGGPRRSWRLLFAIAGAAAAVTLVVLFGSNIFPLHQSTTVSGSAALASASNAGKPTGSALPRAADKAPSVAALSAPPLIRIGLSRTRYTQAAFVTQAQGLLRAPFQPMATESSSLGPAGTSHGITQCLSAIGAAGAQMVRADVAFYQGRPAVVILATANGMTTAYVVGRQCSLTDAALMRAATPVP
jgi:hypothetical protein